MWSVFVGLLSHGTGKCLRESVARGTALMMERHLYRNHVAYYTTTPASCEFF